MLAGRNPDADLVSGMDHDAVGADIDPSGVRIAHHDQVFRADIAAAVELVDERRGELGEVDLLVTQDVLEHRAARKHARRDHAEVALHARLVGFDDVDASLGDRHAEHHGQPLEGVRRAGEDAEAALEALDLVEQQGRLHAGIAGGDHLGKRAQFELGIRPLDELDLAHALEAGDQIAQVLMGRTRTFIVAPLILRQSCVHCCSSPVA